MAICLVLAPWTQRCGWRATRCVGNIGYFLPWLIPAFLSLTQDSPVGKALVGASGISTAAGAALSHAIFRELGAPALLAVVVDSLGLPPAVKPVRGSSPPGPDDPPVRLQATHCHGENLCV